MPAALTAPDLLQPGDTVCLIAPAGGIDADYKDGLTALTTRYRVKIRDDIIARHRYLAGNDQRRLSELQQAIDDPQVKAIFAVRGGQGCIRLLDQLNLTVLKAHPKWLVGYSDITGLHAAWARTGIQSIHGPNAYRFDQLDDRARQQFFTALEQPPHIEFNHLQTLHHGSGAGPLVGGNLTLVAAMLGTPDFPPIEGAVLLLEDINEQPYRIDRLLTQLMRAGVFERVAAVALGRFNSKESHGMDEVLIDRLSQLPCPVVRGLPVGHKGQNVPLHLGSRVHVTAESPEVSGSGRMVSEV